MWLAFLVLPRSASLCPSCWREQRGSEQGQEVVFLTFVVLLLGTSLTPLCHVVTPILKDLLSSRRH